MSDAEIRSISLIDETGERRVRMATSPSWAPFDQRVSAMHRADEGNRVPRSAPDVSRTGSTTRPTDHPARRWLSNVTPVLTLIRETIGDGLPMDDIDGSATSSPCRRSVVPGRVRRREAATRAARRPGARADGDPDQPRRCSSTSRSSDPRVQAPALNIIEETVALYDQIRSHPGTRLDPRVKIFAGKAAPTYHNAVDHQLANDVAR